MATLNLNLAIAILLALFNFAAESDDVRVDFLDPAGERIETVRLARSAGDRFDLLAKSEGEWVKAGDVASVSGRPGVYRFGGAPADQAIDLAAVIADWAAVSDPTVEQAAFEARLADKAVRILQVRSADVILLLDSAGQVAFVLHRVPRAAP